MRANPHARRHRSTPVAPPETLARHVASRAGFRPVNGYICRGVIQSQFDGDSWVHRRICQAGLSEHRVKTKVMMMPEPIARSDDDAQRAIQALSEKLDVPELKVLEVYKTEYHRLLAQSRIATYVSVLAMRNTRSILRESGRVN